MLKLENLNLVAGKKTIAKNLNLHIKSGELVVLTGANGSGKSTLAKTIMGIESVKNGKIFFKNQDITDLSIDKRAKLGLAFSLQKSATFKGLTVFDLLSLASEPEINRTTAGEILRKVGLNNSYLTRELTNDLSGGEMKRIELASTLVRSAEFFIFDEPESGIDLWSFAELTKLFTELKNNNKTLLVISHQSRILKQADRILLLKNGKIIDFDDYKNFSQAVKL
mgnify:CR=1 FL=1